MLKKWQTFIIVTMAIIIMMFSGCILGRDGGDGGALPPPPGSLPSPQSKPERIIADVYWDATVSMKGFTALASGNVFRALPDTLGNMGSALGEIHFFRFGEEVIPIEGREYRRFSSPECYTETVTSFGNVLDAADPNHLSVVVTDLFESDADWSNVTQKLREKYFSNHFTVAIIGIKNSFSGEIFDVGLNAATYSYDSGDDSALFRPFYLFLMGEEAQVRAFIDQWKTQPVANNEMKYVVLSEYLGTYVPDANHSVKKNMIEDRRLSKVDECMREVTFSDRKKPAEITVPGKYLPYPDTCILNIDGDSKKIIAAEENVKIFTLDEKNQWQEYESKQQLNNGLQMSSILNDNDKNNISCDIKMEFTSAAVLPRGRIGLLQTSIAPTRQSIQLPEWIDEWDMGDVDTRPEEFDGAKTVNLKRIALSLKDSLFASAQPIIAEIYLVIDGR